MTTVTDGRPRWWGRALLAAVAGLTVAAALALVTGLGTTSPTGVEDNGDGYRLFCGAGLAPATADGYASWKGGVVTTFVRAAPCADPQPSSARAILQAAVAGQDGAWSLGTLAAVYAGLFGLVTAVAVAAASARGPLRAAVVAVPVLPVLATPFARFLLSTYGEPAGLLGTVAAGCGVAVVAVTRPADRGARAAALALLAVGGVVAATAKVAYVPVLLAALAVAAGTALGRRPGRRRVAGPLVAVLAAVAVVAPLGAAVARQGEQYRAVNTHDLVFTLVLHELGPSATAPLGLPPEAAASTGDGYFGGPARPDADWWRRAIVDDPGPTRAAALRLLAASPTTLARAVGTGLQATTHADLVYLRATPADPSLGSAGSGPDVGRSGAEQPYLDQVLDRTRRPPWLPTAVVVLGLLALLAAAVPAVRRRFPAAARWAAAAGLAATTALALVVLAVLGDGYYEVFKHVWLAAYLLVVAGVCLGATAVAALLGRRGVAGRGVGTPAG